MKMIDEACLEERLRRGTRALVPDKAKEIWERPMEKARRDEWYLDGAVEKKRHKGKIIAFVSLAAACFAVCFLSFYMVSLRVDATVYLDVNPSVTLQVNCNENVIRAQAANRDGEIVLEDMDLKNTDLNVAVNAILGSMVKHGYLGETKDAVLLSVNSGSRQKTEKLRSRLSGEINACLSSLIGSGAVFDQEVESDGELEALAEEYGITPGKAALIRRVAAANPGLEYGELAGLSMSDLTQTLAGAGVDLRDYANYSGSAENAEQPILDRAPDEDGRKTEDAREEDSDDTPASAAQEPKDEEEESEDSPASQNEPSSAFSIDIDEDDDDEGDGFDEESGDADGDLYSPGEALLPHFESRRN